MKMKFRYKIVLEGEYEVDPGLYDTDNPNEIAESEREWASDGIADFIDSNNLEPTEVVIIPI